MWAGLTSLSLRGKQRQLKMFQGESEEQIIRFHPSVLFTELLQNRIYFLSVFLRDVYC